MIRKIWSDFKEVVRRNPKGSVPTIYNRFNFYYGVPRTFIQLAILYGVYKGMVAWYWLLLLLILSIVLSALWMIYDMARIMPQQRDLDMVQSKTIRKMVDDLKDIKQALNVNNR